MVFHRPAVLTRPGGEFAGGDGFAFGLFRHTTGEWGMSTFDDPFDPARRLRFRGCVCGRHAARSSMSTRRNSRWPARPWPEEEKRYEGVVASAVMRAVFPKDAARRAFLVGRRLDRARRTLAVLPAQDRDRSVRARRGALEKKDLKVGFIPITCATPIIMAEPMGFYAKQASTSTWSRPPAGR